MARPRKILAYYGPIDYGASKTFNFDDEEWTGLTFHIPVAHEAQPGLRLDIEHVCACVIGLAKVNRIGDAAASVALPPAGNARRAALERLVAALEEAQAAWQEMRAAGFRPSAIIGADGIEQLAARARTLLDNLPVATRAPVEPWPILVRSVAAAFWRAGYEPGAHKRGYEPRQRPTWFQDFVWELNNRLPAKVRRPAASREAFDAAVAIALSESAGSDEEVKLNEVVNRLAGLAKELAQTGKRSGEK
jgi:hypothetical protein